MSKDLKDIDWDAVMKRITSTGGRAPERIVSYDEHELIQEMSKEDKITSSGYPKTEYLDEYFKRLKTKKEFRELKNMKNDVLSGPIDWDAVMKRATEQGLGKDAEIIIPEKYLDKSSLFTIDPTTYNLWKQTAELGPIDWDLVIKRLEEAMKK